MQQASERGLVAGDLTIQMLKQVRSGLTPGGLAIDAAFAQPASVLSSPAQFVLLVEKDAVFQRLTRDHFEQKWRCIIVTVCAVAR